MGEKILETDLYELYWRSSELKTCGWAGISAEIVQIFKVGPEFAIKDNIDYEERFEQEILPALKTQCKSLRGVTIDHYIKGVKLNEWLKEYREDESVSGSERPLSTTNVTLDAQGAPVMYRMNGYDSLVELRTKRAVLYPDMAKDEENRKKDAEDRNKWRKRAEDAAVKFRAAEEAAEQREEAAEQKLAATNATADGQLQLSGIENEHKRLFLMIYDGNFVDLSERKDVQDLPAIFYRWVIINYSEVCQAFLSRDAIRIEETWERFDHDEVDYIGRTTTRVYVKERLIVFMEPRYKEAFELVARKNDKKLLNWFLDHLLNKRPGAPTEAPLVEALKERTRWEKVRKALSVLLPKESCGKPGTIRFMDNLTRYVTHAYSSDEYDHTSPVNGTSSYTEKIEVVSGTRVLIERFYENIPRTFSPDFPVPKEGEEIFIWLDKKAERRGLRSVYIKTLQLMDLTPDRTNTKIELPSDVQQAVQERKYFVVKCEYLVGLAAAKNQFFWNANGPLPSESVQAFAKNNIYKARTSCPSSP